MKAVAKHFPTFAHFRTRLAVVTTRLAVVNYRPITRRCLVFLAVMVVVVGLGAGAFWNHQRCRHIAFDMELMGGCLDARGGGNMTSGNREWVRWCKRMESKYRMAAWQPWLLLVPDPVEPGP